jgi:hypothetical protein
MDGLRTKRRVNRADRALFTMLAVMVALVIEAKQLKWDRPLRAYDEG